MHYSVSLVFLLFLLGCNNSETSQEGSLHLVEKEKSLAPPKIDKPINAKGILRIGVLGDLNGSLGDPNYSSTVSSSLKHMLNSNFEIILGTGDFTSGEDYKKRFPASRFTKMWDSFENKVLNKILKKGIRFAPSPGNHDASIQRERGYYLNFWREKNLGLKLVSGEAYPFYYSFIYKGVFFISLDDVKTGRLRERSINGVSQRTWVKNQLSSPEARAAVARIAFGHVPLYPVLSKSKHSSNGKYYAVLRDEQQGRRADSLEQIFKEGDLSLAIFGHSHAYYPGVVHHRGEPLEDSLNVLSMPCAGHGNRYLDQRTSSRSPRGYGHVTVDLETGKVAFDAYTSKGALVSKSSLPRRIKPYSSVTIHRNDLVLKELQQE